MDDLLFILSLSLKLFTLYFAAVAVFTLRRRRKYPRAIAQTKFAVVVAARNEEAVIGNLVHSVLSQDYPASLRDIYVVPNNCSDFTEAAAVAAGARIIHCVGPVSSKGDALHEAFEQLLPLDYDAFVVFDADNVLERDYLARVNDAIVAGAKVLKTQTRAGNPTASGVAGCYGLYNTCFDLIWNRPRAACGLSARLVGSGFAVCREVLEELGGWNTSTITEDAEFATQCARIGHRIWWVPDAVNYDEEPNSFFVSLRQRKRWCSGVMQVGKQELGRLWSADCPKPWLRWDISMYLLTPFTQAISALLLFGGLLFSLASGEEVTAVVTVCTVGLYYVGGVGLSVLLCLLGGYGLQGMTRTILLFPIFMASWLPLQIISLFRDTRKWHAIAHSGHAPVTGYRAMQ